MGNICGLVITARQSNENILARITALKHFMGDLDYNIVRHDVFCQKIYIFGNEADVQQIIRFFNPSWCKEWTYEKIYKSYIVDDEVDGGNAIIYTKNNNETGLDLINIVKS